MPASVFFDLKVGDKVIIHWAKDDDPARTRLNHEIMTVTGAEPDEIVTGDYEWSRSEMTAPGSNCLDTGRGYAFLFYP